MAETWLVVNPFKVPVVDSLTGAVLTWTSCEAAERWIEATEVPNRPARHLSAYPTMRCQWKPPKNNEPAGG